MVSIKAKTLQGKVFTIDVDATSTVAQIKAKIEAEQGPTLPADRLKLIHQGKVLSDEKAFSEYNIGEDEFIVVMAAAKKATPTTITTTTTTTSAAAPVPATTTAAPAPAPPVAPPPAPPAPPSGPPPATVAALVEMGFPQSLVVQALTAAGNNQDVALEFLLSGHVPPTTTTAASTGSSSTGADATSSASAATTSTTASTSGVGAFVPRGVRTGLASHPQIQELRRILTETPGEMEAAIARLQVEHPDLMAQINQNPEEFWHAVNDTTTGSGEGAGGEEDEDEEGSADMEEAEEGSAAAAGEELSEADEAAVTRLMDILGGFSRDQVVQAYLLAGKDENGAINMLLG